MARFSYDKELQARIGRRVLVIMAPLICMVTIVSSVVVLLETPEQWQRTIPGAIGVVTLIFVWILADLRRIREAMSLLFAVALFGLFFAMYLGGGVRTPFYTGSMCILAVAAWYYPWRIAVLMWASYLLMGGFFVWFEWRGYLPLVSPPGTLVLYTFLTVYYTVVLLATVTPSRMLHKELSWSKAKQAEAEALARELEHKERALSASELELRQAQRTAHMGNWSRNLVTGEIRWSEEMFRMGGIEPQPVTMALMQQYIYPEDAAHFEAMPASDGQSETEVEFRIVRPDGELRWIYDRWKSEFGPDGAEILRVGISQDITERKHNETMLRVQAELSRALLDAPDLDTVLRKCTEAAISAEGLDCGGIYLEAEGAFHLAYCQGLGRAFLDAVSYLATDSLNTAVILKGKPVYTEYELLDIALDEVQRAEGLRAIAVVPVLYRDKVISCLNAGSHTQDMISERTRAVLETIANYIGGAIVRTKALNAQRQSQNNLQTLFDSVEDFLFVLDFEGTILDVNKAVLDRLGHSRAELIGESVLLLHPPSRREEATAAFAAIWAGTSDICHLPLYTVQQTEIPVETRIARGEWNGKAVFFGISRDITERLQSEQEKEILEQQFLQAQKMEAVGQLAGGVAHDFNNLLQVITGATELILDDLDNKHPARKMTHNILEASSRAKELVEQLLAFSRRRLMRPKYLSINDIIGALLKMLGRLIGEDIRLNWQPGREPGIVFGDRGMLDQVLMNLCVNARDAMPKGGTLTIATRRAPLNEAYCALHTWASPGEYVVISVQDTGCGMDKETLGHIFEPFFTTKPQGKGTGLGLATVYGIVRQHNGMIFPRSVPGKGTSFEIYLPAAKEAPNDPEATVAVSCPGGNETILIAEDDAPVREITRTFLERAGYHVMEARDGREAIERIEACPDAIHLALLDVVMPNMGGREVWEYLREQRPGIPVLFTSGYNDSALHTDFIFDSGVTLLRKPIEQAMLLTQVRDTLDRG